MYTGAHHLDFSGLSLSLRSQLLGLPSVEPSVSPAKCNEPSQTHAVLLFGFLHASHLYLVNSLVGWLLAVSSLEREQRPFSVLFVTSSPETVFYSG